MTEPLSKVFLILCLFQLKHFICDWVIQTDKEVKYKGSYLHPYGILHSVKHSVLTLCILMFFIPSVTSVLFALFDGIIHYHIDWTKQNYTKKFNITPQHKSFWVAIGFDQMLHQLTYLYILYRIVL